MQYDCLYTVMSICLQAARPTSSPTVFGVGEFLTAVAIFAAAYSMSDYRYKFRISIAWISLPVAFFLATAFVGVALITIAIWFEAEMPIPRALNNPRYFEASFALIFFLLLTTWIYVGFVKPPRFSRRNAERFAQRVFQGIADGIESELAAVVHEVGRSAPEIVREARKRVRQRNVLRGGFTSLPPKSAEIANQILSLIGDRRFCRFVARQAPWVAAEIFRSIGSERLLNLPVQQFSQNVAAELFADENSAIHHEDDGFRSGLIGHMKPVSTSLFGNSRLVDELARAAGSPLSPLWFETRSWSPRSWQTYNKAVLVYLEDRLKRHDWLHEPGALYDICNGYEYSLIDTYKINGLSEAYGQSIEYQRLTSTVDFIDGALKLLERKGLHADRKSTLHEGHILRDDLFDLLAHVAFELIASAGRVNTPEFRSWGVHYVAVWSRVMNRGSDTLTNATFRSRLQQLIWHEIRHMEKLPNYKGAGVILVCLNTMGLRMDHAVNKPKETRALKRALLAWVRQHYLTIVAEYPNVARACTGGGITFDGDKQALVKTYRSILGRDPNREILPLV